MQAAANASRMEGIEIASVIMGTPNNKPLLEEAGLFTSIAQSAGPNDIIIAIKGNSEENVTNAIEFVIDLLSKEVVITSDDAIEYKSLGGALAGLPQANLAVISVPGIYAARETRKALENDLNVLLFSDNVSIEDELQIKTLAHEKGLIVMGPDAGTAIIKGIGLGFANNVIPGPIGIVAASGTGTQEVSVLCHQEGIGVTHAIGTGSRDVKDAVGGITMIDGLNALERDPTIELIILISKPPETKTMRKILDRIKNASKPVVINFLGRKAGYCDLNDRYVTVTTLEEAALTATNYFSSKRLNVTKSSPNIINSTLEKFKSQKSQGRFIRGLYAGGTFTFEAAMIISQILENSNSLWTNVRLEGTLLLPDPRKSQEHTLIDMGGEEFTSGKPHPMIDQFERTERFLREIKDPEVGVILLDFVLGYGSHPDPVSDMEEAFEEWIKLGKPMPIICHVCGTELDIQDYEKSISNLQNWGVIVMPTNSQMAQLAASLIKQYEEE